MSFSRSFFRFLPNGLSMQKGRKGHRCSQLKVRSAKEAFSPSVSFAPKTRKIRNGAIVRTTMVQKPISQNKPCDCSNVDCSNLVIVQILWLFKSWLFKSWLSKCWLFKIILTNVQLLEVKESHPESLVIKNR